MPTNINTLSTTSPAPWKDEFFHADGSHPRLYMEKGAAGQRRLSRHYAAALAASPLESAQALAEKLRACKPNHRCGGGICPSCTWATNRWFRKTALAFTDSTTLMLFSTVQLPDSRAMPTSLDYLDLEQQKGLLADIFDAAGLGDAPVFGAMDLCKNIWLVNGIWRWSAHWALFTPDRDRVAFTAAITSVLPHHTLVPVPVKTRVISRTPDKVFSYGFKSVFERKLIPPSDFGRGDTSIIRAGEAEFGTLAVNLDRIGIMARFFTQACSFANGEIISHQ